MDRSRAFDEEITGRGPHVANAGECRGRRGRCAEELVPIDHDPPFPNIDGGCSLSATKLKPSGPKPRGRSKQHFALSVTE
jgi:hypothetical protein